MSIPSIYFFAFFLLRLHLAFGIVDVNTTLSANDQNDRWLSSSQEFAFGFRRINNTNLFLLAIWYDKIPDKTVVWNANMSNPAVPSGSRVQLTRTGLSLTNPQGQAIWNSTPQEDVSHAEMRDDGNFVLVASSNSSHLWESFKNPTDTLLPNQTLGLDGKLSSRLAQSNYTKGRFELYFEGVNLALSQIGWPTEFRYKKYYEFDANLNDSVSGLVFNSAGNVSVGQRPLWDGLDNDVNRYYYRATLDYYGVFTLYSYPRNPSYENQVWSFVKYVPDDGNVCTVLFGDLGSGCCGYNSYCVWNSNDGRPTCECPDWYSLVDPNDEFGGCEPNLPFGCAADDEESKANPEKVYEMKILQKNVNWPLGDYERLLNYTEDECSRSCLYDCNCAVAIFNNHGDCWKKRLPLSNGRYLTSADGTTVLMKIRIRPLGMKKEDRVYHALLGLFIGFLVINTFFVAKMVSIVLLKSKKDNAQVSSPVETNMHSFTFEALKEATSGFNEEVGRGSFGTVYKGTLNSRTNAAVAVKRLDRIAQEREKEFRTELSAIGKTCHRNLVRLIGFCDEGVHRLLVYEFMSNGTLADILFRQPKPKWNLRVSLALGIARGLLYLHEECETPIIHCDIKPQNILIDENFMPKISDFGLAKLLYSNKSRTHTMIRGTRGYVAPEWFKSIPVTAKVDVYSYGVMLLEIICCRRSLEMDLDKVGEDKAILTDWAYDCYMEGRIDILVQSDEEAIADIGRLKKWVMIAIWCIQENPEIRPTMKTVMQMLEGLIQVPSPPLPSSFYSTVRGSQPWK
ncbi:G-type lectin S-receptor-like serine/threonine-protein kinase LECRK4 [Neltuma alba]|uniref:G-type lectin S-receptor-like serine/threonine-protein kinase LECRK4 n=1 Tax=Neltuma alba TaxID=207710 RepID=UPI0010A31614|nr:G-type lectin S-receptor-like serine/threonine-protein kinase LECRK4 [Prosopis alba]